MTIEDPGKKNGLIVSNFRLIQSYDKMGPKFSKTNGGAAMYADETYLVSSEIPPDYDVSCKISDMVVIGWVWERFIRRIKLLVKNWCLVIPNKKQT